MRKFMQKRHKTENESPVFANSFLLESDNCAFLISGLAVHTKDRRLNPTEFLASFILKNTAQSEAQN